MPQSARPKFTIPTGPTAFTLAIRPDGAERLKKRAKATTDKELAWIMGVDQGQLSRILAGTSIPGARVIAGTISAFGWAGLKDLFVVVPVENKGNRGAA